MKKIKSSVPYEEYNNLLYEYNTKTRDYEEKIDKLENELENIKNEHLDFYENKYQTALNKNKHVSSLEYEIKSMYRDELKYRENIIEQLLDALKGDK